jgi:CheY-like chemotaxis protein
VTTGGALTAHAEASSRVPRERGPLAGLCVLVVEDDPASAKLVSIVLAGEGAEVHTASSAEDALEHIGRFAPRLIVLDLVLPFMSGLLLAQRLKASPATRDSVIIAVTSFNGPEIERLTRSAGCDAYVRKPIDVHSFARLVATHMGERS